MAKTVYTLQNPSSRQIGVGSVGFLAAGSQADFTVDVGSAAEDSILAAISSGIVSRVFKASTVTPGEWIPFSGLIRLLCTGTGVLTMDSRNSLRDITLAVHGPVSLVSATNQVEFPYPGDDAVEIRLSLTGTATAKVI